MLTTNEIKTKTKVREKEINSGQEINRYRGKETKESSKKIRKTE
jgi:hypothetical protein